MVESAKRGNLKLLPRFTMLMVEVVTRKRSAILGLASQNYFIRKDCYCCLAASEYEPGFTTQEKSWMYWLIRED